MFFNFKLSKKFRTNLKKFSSEEQKQINNKLRLLTVDPFYPSLRSKCIHGAADGVLESSVNMDIRIIWYYGDDGTIILADVGHHNIIDNY